MISWVKNNWHVLLAIPVAGWLILWLFQEIVNYTSKLTSSPHEETGENKLTPSQASALADKIHQGVKFSWVSDDYQQVVSVVKKLKNPSQWHQIIDAYGERREHLFGVPTGDEVPLRTMLSRELPQWAKTEVKSHLRQIGLNPKFI
jgi:hypothetical protein